MRSHYARRLAQLEDTALRTQRSTVAGLVALLETGTLSIQQLTDEELTSIVNTNMCPAPDMTSYTDKQLDAIIHGRWDT